MFIEHTFWSAHLGHMFWSAAMWTGLSFLSGFCHDFFQIFTTSILCHFWSCHLGSSRCHSGCSGLQLQYCHAGSRLRPRCHPFEEAQEVLWSSSIVVSGPSWQRIVSFFTGLLRQDSLSSERWTDSIRQLNQMDFPLQNIYFGVPPCMEPPKWCYINDVRWCWM